MRRRGDSGDDDGDGDDNDDADDADGDDDGVAAAIFAAFAAADGSVVVPAAWRRCLTGAFDFGESISAPTILLIVSVARERNGRRRMTMGRVTAIMEGPDVSHVTELHAR